MPDLFGRKLLFLRKQRGLTQEQLAGRPGMVSQSHITDLENQKSTVSLTQLVRLADFFGVPTDYLLRDTVAVEAVAPAPGPYAPIDDARLKQIVSARLRTLQTERDITARRLALHVGVSRTFLVNIAAGRKLPSLELVVRLADFFGVQTDDLLKAEG